ncbi:hypothetical protein P154DRAFT_246622 [Amniculicola lignicola CBS 123094]|uniref:Uncharacterized protein n=1 Tax=Amniculicola lignicola CBS 123094 TaxID=1392246 RepID=A0A6A5WCV5_9PLEO|nr:hypothetical protein P154DRAFT_246622 [Amniculicola lignicola CBS 123094]
MKAIAEDSKQVALATSKDSAVMVIIAILTMVFLPATFTATLFSTTFFDFRKEKGKTVVSTTFWIYWVVTLALTLVTMTCAGYFWRMRDRKMRLTFEKGREELEKIDSTGKAVE